MTKIKLEIESDSDNELLSATINLKYKDNKSYVKDIDLVNNSDSTKESNKIPSNKAASKKSKSGTNSGTIYDDLKKLPAAEEGEDESFSTKW